MKEISVNNNFQRTVFVVTSVFSLLLAAAKVFCGGMDARIIEYSGKVGINLRVLNRELALNVRNFPLEPGDEITTYEDSGALILINGAAVIEMEENSKMSIHNAGEENIDIFIKAGSAAASFDMSLDTGPVRIITNTALIDVRKAAFLIDIYRGKTEIAVFEGDLTLGYFNPLNQPAEETYLLEKNEEAEIYFRSAPNKIEGVSDKMIENKGKLDMLQRKRVSSKRSYKRLSPEKRAAERNRLLRKILK